MTQEQEQKNLNQNIQLIKNNCFNLLNHINASDRHRLDIAGYTGKTNAEAMQMAFNDANKRIQKLLKEFESKYPN